MPVDDEPESLTNSAVFPTVRELDGEFHDYFNAIASSRYVSRKVYRLIDEQAKSMGLDPLEHQALIQVFGSDTNMVTVKGLAERLDVGADVASKLVRVLERKGLVVRSHSIADRRITHVNATVEGATVLGAIDDRVQESVGDMQSRLSLKARSTALKIFGFYVGITVATVDNDNHASA